MNITKNIATFIALAGLSIGSLHAVDVVGVDKKTVTLNDDDAVAYFTQNSAVIGSNNYTAAHNNAIYNSVQ